MSLLSITGLQVSYGAIEALHGIDLEVGEGHIVSLIGANGAGKSTTLRTISGLVRPTAGLICFRGTELTRLAAHEVARLGIAHVPEGRMIFPEFTVSENLAMGSYARRDRKEIPADLEFVFTFFPRLRERRSQRAGTLSGGEQQMLAIGRALMSGSRFLMLDEPSLGIAPMLVESIFERLLEIRRERGMTILLVEQNAHLALQVSDYAYVLETGRILLHGPSAELRDNPKVQAAYLGGG